MSYKISNLSTTAISIGTVQVPVNGSGTYTEQQLAGLTPGELVTLNSHIASGMASVTYNGWTPPAADNLGGTTPITNITYSAASQAISINPMFTSPLGQALVLAPTQAAMQAVMGAASSAAATTSTAGVVKQGVAVSSMTDSVTGLTPGTNIVDVTATPTQATINQNFFNLMTQLNSLITSLTTAGVIV